MFYILKLKKIIAKLLTCWILSEKVRKNARNFLFYFSFTDFIKFKRQNFYIVSLGYNCMPRVLTTALRLKPRKIYGEKTCPFDLSLNFDINKIAELINNDFQNFFDNLAFNNNTKKWENKYLNSIYIHDSKLDRKQFVLRYKKRIANFLNIMKSEKIVYFIFHPYDKKNPDKSEILNLYNTLTAKRQKKPFKLIIINNKFINKIDRDNLTQIIEDFSTEIPDWAKNIIDDYGQFNNNYTKFRKETGAKLKQIIHN